MGVVQFDHAVKGGSPIRGHSIRQKDANAVAVIAAAVNDKL